MLRQNNNNSLCYDGGGSSRLVLPVSGELLVLTVVSGKSVDFALVKNKSKFGVLVLSVLLKMLADSHGLLDKHIQILGDLRGKACQNRIQSDTNSL